MARWIALTAGIALVVTGLVVLDSPESDSSRAGPPALIRPTLAADPPGASSALQLAAAPEPLAAPAAARIDTESTDGETRSAGSARASTPPPAESPLVAHGRLDVAPELGAVEVRVELTDARGARLARVEPDDTARYALRHAEPLDAGWAVTARVVRGRAASVVALQSRPHPVGAPPVSVDLVVAAPVRLTGRVRSAADGAPLTNAEVLVVSDVPGWRDRPDETTTDAAGRFALELGATPPTRLTVIARAGGHEAATIEALDVEPGTTRELELSLVPERRLVGRVLDGGGAPVPGAELLLLPGHFVLSDEIVASTTDAAGAYTLPTAGLTLAGSDVFVRAHGFAPRRVPAEAVLAAPDLVLDPAVTIHGVVRAASSSPMANRVLVRLVDDRRASRGAEFESDETISDPDGRFELQPWACAPEHARLVVLDARGRLVLSGALSDLARPLADGDLAVELDLAH